MVYFSGFIKEVMKRVQASLLILLAIFPFIRLSGQAGESKPKMVIVNPREKKISPAVSGSVLPFVQWESPDSLNSRTDFAVTEISGIVYSASRLTGLRLYINGEIVNDGKSFSVLPGNNQNENSITRTVTLEEGLKKTYEWSL